ncbi:DUF58 domain-containing protein [Phycisphaera mikurensis]|uniref:DUF58 domain-containing protein n=1 Tax=Phycisphaera mikurensis (strain NBRC 102666 / KCTC 22515 / FYK2301M01) TaxID=1142394 RepID=I0IJ26_PHYMF|nr:DUF58 domain-containing protein [Phycisphaera mikurensis]MBB6443111.1 uncharacterized protein (DUF58 family) [Phycisphaera mikurensis]BAM05264.1 hypothetical protein PSMK_31050 [Phycisphaera mikurensis NBRC 102666]
MAPGFFGAAVLVLATALYTQANLLFWLFGLGAGAAAFALLHGSLVLRRLEATRVRPGRCVAGAPLSLGYTLRNRGRLACLSLRVRELGDAAEVDALPWAWVPQVRPGAAVLAEATGPAPGRGERRLTAFEVSTTFPLGLFRRSRVFEQEDVLRVLPGVTPLAPRLVARAARPLPGPDGVAARVAPGVEGDFYGSRGYRPGDPLRTLDWKRSARQGELMVRELARPEPPRVVVLLDLRSPEGGAADRADAEAAEAAIRVAASLVARAHAGGFRVGLHAAGVSMPGFTPHHALAHRDRLLAALGRLDLSAPPPAADPSPRVLHDVTVRVCPAAATPGEPAAAVLCFAATGGRNPRPVAAEGPVAQAVAVAAAGPAAARAHAVAEGTR